jgi:hypothetical protein
MTGTLSEAPAIVTRALEVHSGQLQEVRPLPENVGAAHDRVLSEAYWLATLSDARTVTDMDYASSSPRTADRPREAGRTSRSVVMRVGGLILLAGAEAVQLNWVVWLWFWKSLAESESGEPSAGADLFLLALQIGLLILPIGFVACMVGSRRGIRIAAVCGVAMVGAAFAIAVASYGPSIGDLIQTALMLAFPGLLLLAYVWAVKRHSKLATKDGIEAPDTDVATLIRVVAVVMAYIGMMIVLEGQSEIAPYIEDQSQIVYIAWGLAVSCFGLASGIWARRPWIQVTGVVACILVGGFLTILAIDANLVITVAAVVAVALLVVAAITLVIAIRRHGHGGRSAGRPGPQPGPSSRS